MKLSIKDFFIICDQIRMKLRILSQLLKKFLKENLIFCGLKPHLIQIYHVFLVPDQRISSLYVTKFA